MSIEYEENKVTNSEVESYRRDLYKASSERKLGRWMAYRHYAQLKREQEQAYHFHYLSSPKGSHCTCGLIVGVGDELLALHYPNEDLNLQPLQMVAGHRNLPSCTGIAVALIVAFLFVEEIDDYLWTAYCQVCGEFVRQVPQVGAKAFVKGHNVNCQK